MSESEATPEPRRIYDQEIDGGIDTPGGKGAGTPETSASTTPTPDATEQVSTADDDEGRTGNFESSLDSWDANKANHEAREWEESLLRQTEIGTKTKKTPGVDDFSDASRQRFDEAVAYNKYMEGFSDDDRDPLSRSLDQADATEVVNDTEDTVERVINSTPQLHKMDLLARQIANLRKEESTKTGQELASTKALRSKLEDMFNEMALSYFDQANPLDDKIYNRLVDRTEPSGEESGQPVQEGQGAPETPGGEGEGQSGEETPEKPGEGDDKVDVPAEGADAGGEGYPENPDAGQEIVVYSPWSRVERELYAGLEQARDKYAKETAKDRKKFWGRFLSANSTFAIIIKARIPGMKRMADWLNQVGSSNNEMDVRGNYEQALKDCLASAEEKYRSDQEGELSEEYRKTMVTSALLEEDKYLEEAIVKHQSENSKAANIVSNWWIRHSGWSKALIVAGGGLAGLAAGMAGAGALATGAAGAVIGGAMAVGATRYMNNRRDNSIVDKGSGKTYAQEQSVLNREEKEEAIQEAVGDYEGSDAAAERFVATNERLTDDEVAENRRNLMINTTLGAIAGGAAGIITGLLNGNRGEHTAVSGGGTNGSTEGTQTGGGGQTGGVEGGSSASGGGAAAEVTGKAEELYKFGYSEAPETLLRHISPNLRGDQAYRAINYLMNHVPHDQIFEGVRMGWHGAGNAWILDPGGSTHGLTSQAAAALQQGLASGVI